jgi:transposase
MASLFCERSIIMVATRQIRGNGEGTALYLAFELGWFEWKLAFSVGLGQKPRLRTIRARSLAVLEKEIRRAKERFGLPSDARVVSCYEAGRDGFWLHRWLAASGIENLVVDSSSIEVNRRARRAKSDRLDAGKLVIMLLRWAAGETKVWGTARVPSDAEEDGRQLHRELEALKEERTGHLNRIKGLLAGQGLAVSVLADFAATLNELRRWDDTPVPASLRARLLREFERLQFLEKQITNLENERRRLIRRDETPYVEAVRALLDLRGIGLNSAWLFVREVFGWRQIKNRRELGALCGLTPTPYASGSSEHEQGISKAGNRWMRKMAVEIAWCWLRYQPQSELAQWYERRFGAGSSRQRRIGIVAVARNVTGGALEASGVGRGAALQRSLPIGA